MILFYVPFPTLDEAQRVARMVLENKLAACVNILPTRHSLFVWPDPQGNQKLCECVETIALFKTSNAQKQYLMKFIEENHSYECPAILSFECQTNKSFETWVLGQV